MDVFISALTRTKMSKAAKRSVEEAEASVKKAKTGDDKKEDVEDEEDEGEEGEEEDDDEGEGVSKLVFIESAHWADSIIVAMSVVYLYVCPFSFTRF